ncbi:hypothetical protein RRG08_023000 [Elysia crispata]|uniref:Schwannomin interacting protein 1 C-terminal domain-containing protein n=1 Tax=Elysia crispata TaxID=231223 RepID=A0AAE1AEE4_9GAST|nr:hypothetical protein RRG08_023000 [Elysia crispata]
MGERGWDAKEKMRRNRKERRRKKKGKRMYKWRDCLSQSCKNDREEIRRRLAMATDEEFGDDVTSCVGSSTAESQPLMMSPRNKRLQARLQGGTSGMQICFMNDDILDDDDEDADGGDGSYDDGNDYDDDLPTPRQGDDITKLLGRFDQGFAALSSPRLIFQSFGDFQPGWVS